MSKYYYQDLQSLFDSLSDIDDRIASLSAIVDRLDTIAGLLDNFSSGNPIRVTIV